MSHEIQIEEDGYYFFVDYEEGVGRPQRVFEAATDIVTAFEMIDKTLAACFGNIEIEIKLDQIESGSLKAFLRSILRKVDDADIQDLKIKRIIGTFLLAAKYKILEWANETENQKSPHNLQKLASELHNLAAETGVKRLPDYYTPPLSRLASSVLKIDEAKKKLDQSDRLVFRSRGREVEISTSITWSPEELNEVLSEELVSSVPGRAKLVIKKPDFLGRSKWHMRYKGRTIRVKMSDEKWLFEYQLGNVGHIDPGDALEVDLKVEQRKDHRGNVIEEKFIVTKVHKVHPKEYQFRLPGTAI